MSALFSNRMFSRRVCAGVIPDSTLFSAGALFICLVFLVFKSFGACAYAGDEHIYLFQGWLVSEGYVPYRDFPMAHPPLQALLTGLLFKLSGYQFAIGRILPVFFSLAGACVLSLIVRREIGVPAALSAMALYLLSYEPLRASTHFTGVNMTCAFLIFAFYALHRDHFKTAGLLSAFAFFTRLYALPFVCVFALCAVARSGKKGADYACAAAGFIILFSAATLAVCGYEATLRNLITYHLLKIPMAEGTLSSMKNTVLFHNSFIAILTILSVPVYLSSLVFSLRKKSCISLRVRLAGAIAQSNGSLVLESLFAFFCFLSILAAMDRIWMYYFVLLFPFGAIASGWLIQYWITEAVVFTRKFKDRTPVPGFMFLVYGVSVSLAIAGFVKAPVLEQRLGYYAEEMNKPGAERIHYYTFHNGILPEKHAGWMRPLLWKDEREVGKSYWFFHYLLWHESRYLENLDDMVAFIKDHSGEYDEIFGDSGAVPLLALESGRRIAANEVDTNVQRYRSGNTDIKHLIRMIDTPKTRLVILRRNFGIAGLEEVRRWVDEKYCLVKTSSNAEGETWFFYERR